MMHRELVNKIFNTLQQNNPNPTTELNYQSNFELLIAVILSAQATDISVNKATESLFKRANTPAKMVALGEEGLKAYIKTIGLYNSKAKNIIAACQKLITDFHGAVPATREELESLPGVGRKTANVVLNTAFGHAAIAVDTHIFRVSRRIGLSDGKNPLQVELDLEKIIPSKYKKDAHHWLILHGRYICKARRPECGICSINKYCEWYRQQSLS
jgi:endonuclease-3